MRTSGDATMSERQRGKTSFAASIVSGSALIVVPCGSSIARMVCALTRGGKLYVRWSAPSRRPFFISFAFSNQLSKKWSQSAMRASCAPAQLRARWAFLSEVWVLHSKAVSLCLAFGTQSLGKACFCGASRVSSQMRQHLEGWRMEEHRRRIVLACPLALRTQCGRYAFACCPHPFPIWRSRSCTSLALLPCTVIPSHRFCIHTPLPITKNSARDRAVLLPFGQESLAVVPAARRYRAAHRRAASSAAAAANTRRAGASSDAWCRLDTSRPPTAYRFLRCGSRWYLRLAALAR